MGHYFIIRIPKLHQLFGIRNKQHVPFKTVSMETIVRNLFRDLMLLMNYWLDKNCSLMGSLKVILLPFFDRVKTSYFKVKN